ncbi:diguanylate cyclase [Methylobacterium sp. J-078]|uniref:diguanylate cyclase domain-containing protein n=1 Tax=Methylobacterium sp. J-078 TaxID=2836657 RepID=UPI001FB8ACFF|nr:diguanylate cyclase [Methylobacterium sp. J-078]MCJ2045068.1 diguanylate cyclase [Methylobacterium sp. J-078]
MALFTMPVSRVSLIDANRLWLEEGAALQSDEFYGTDLFRDRAMLSNDVLIVADAAGDTRFRDPVPDAGASSIRFYAGAPLLAEGGLRVGILSVMDVVPRHFSEADRARLIDLASVLSAQLALERANLGLRERETHHRLVAESSADMVIWATLDTVRRYVSPAAGVLLGYAPEELVGTKSLDQVHPDEAEAYGKLLADLCEGRITRSVACQRYRRRDGGWIWVEAIFKVTFDPEGHAATGYVAAIRDITERKEAEHQIAHMARHDALTDLANRVLFRERLVQEIAASRRGISGFAVLCLDLDRFKAVNDSLGHQVGDVVLRIVGQRLRALLRAEDTVGRIGGDEFMIIQTGPLVTSSIRNLTRRIIDTIAEPITIANEPIVVGVSIGVAMAPRDGLDPDTLCRNADMALLEAKRTGRNTFRYYEASMRFGSLASGDSDAASESPAPRHQPR